MTAIMGIEEDNPAAAAVTEVLEEAGLKAKIVKEHLGVTTEYCVCIKTKSAGDCLWILAEVENATNAQRLIL